jgi:hypothetical protein
MADAGTETTAIAGSSRALESTTFRCGPHPVDARVDAAGESPELLDGSAGIISIRFSKWNTTSFCPGFRPMAARTSLGITTWNRGDTLT